MLEMHVFMPAMFVISAVHERPTTLGDPIRTPTPYGGRLTWVLPGGTPLVVHLKDKHKIRHKKRWSQVHCFKDYIYITICFLLNIIDYFDSIDIL